MRCRASVLIKSGVLLTAALVPAANPLRAQTPSRAQQTACDRHHVGRWCRLLAQDFSQQQVLVSPLGDLTALGADMAPAALRRVLEAQAKTALKTQVEQAGQRALQTISVAGAVNQTSGAATAGASTDLAAKPTTTDFLSVAESTGGFTQTQNGSAVTLQADALGMTKYLRNEPVFQRLPAHAADWLQPLSVSATVNLAQSATSTVQATAPGSAATPTSASAFIPVLIPAANATLASVGANYQIYRRYSPQDKNFQAAWRNALIANQTALATAGAAIARAVNGMLAEIATQQQSAAPGKAALDKAADQWLTEGAAAEQTGDFDAFAAAYERDRDAYVGVLMQNPKTPQAVTYLNLALEAEQEATYTVLDQARGKPLATVSYLYARPTAQPSTHTLTLTVAQLWQSGTQVTGNFAAELYASLPTAASNGRLRDVQLAAELDQPLGGTPANPRATVSLAGYGQYQYSPSVLNVSAATVAPGTAIPVSGQVLAGSAGWLGVVQGKLTLQLRPGFSLPLAIKWSNRTELINASDVRAQFGLSYDLSALGRLIAGGS